MARSARDLFDEAMRLDPQERATLLRLLIEALDADTDDGVEEAWRVEIERRVAELDSGSADARWRRRLSGSTLLPRRRRNPPMTGTPPGMSSPLMPFAKNCAMRSM